VLSVVAAFGLGYGKAADGKLSVADENDGRSTNPPIFHPTPPPMARSLKRN